MSNPLSLALLLSMTLALPALAEGVIENGAKVFKRCAACHSAEEGAKSKSGPNLFGVVGRVTGSLEGFNFSPAMKKAGQEGHVWTVEELDLYLTNPKAMIRGNRMSFAGLRKPEERADLIAWLQSLQPAGESAAAAPAEPAAN